LYYELPYSQLFKVETMPGSFIEIAVFLTSWKAPESSNIIQRIQLVVGMFYRQRMLVIDGKYNNDDGLSTGIMCQVGTKIILGSHSRSSS
jgi:hypothetical protein